MWTKIKAKLAAAKKWIVGVVAAMLAAIAGWFGSDAISQTPVDTVTWTNPTTRTDGTPLTNLRGVLIQWGSSAAGPFNLGSQEVPFPGTSLVVPRTEPFGTRCYVALAVDTNNEFSDPAGPVCKTISAPPSQPTDLAVE